MSKVESWSSTLSVFVSGFVEHRGRKSALFLGLGLNLRSFGLVSFWVVKVELGESKLTPLVAEVAMEAASMDFVEELERILDWIGIFGV